ncbi:MAG TPA: hypothetical protein VMT61_02565 [Candidatus Binataceae bacterium]|nr:hypothetical protein [Candidatus Binataceae bacterium]
MNDTLTTPDPRLADAEDALYDLALSIGDECRWNASAMHSFLVEAEANATSRVGLAPRPA